MQIAQRLYEGLDIGGETVGLITYMRTDSVSLAADAVAEIREVAARLYGPDLDRVAANKKFAIKTIPLNFPLTLSMVSTTTAYALWRSGRSRASSPPNARAAPPGGSRGAPRHRPGHRCAISRSREHPRSN